MVITMIYPKNWQTFQHYRDRNPPWIKLHKSLLDDPVFQCLPVASRALAPMLWLQASSELDGRIDMTTEQMAFRFRMSHKDLLDALNPLISSGLFIGASGMLAECKQVARPETETEAKTKAKKRQIPDDLLPRLENLCASWPSSFEKDGHSHRLPKLSKAQDLWERMIKFFPHDSPEEMVRAGENHLSPQQVDDWSFGAKPRGFTIAMTNFYGQQARWKEFR